MSLKHSTRDGKKQAEQISESKIDPLSLLIPSRPQITVPSIATSGKSTTTLAFSFEQYARLLFEEPLKKLKDVVNLKYLPVGECPRWFQDKQIAEYRKQYLTLISELEKSKIPLDVSVRNLVKLEQELKNAKTDKERDSVWKKIEDESCNLDRMYKKGYLKAYEKIMEQASLLKTSEKQKMRVEDAIKYNQTVYTVAYIGVNLLMSRFFLKVTPALQTAKQPLRGKLLQAATIGGTDGMVFGTGFETINRQGRFNLPVEEQISISAVAQGAILFGMFGALLGGTLVSLSPPAKWAWTKFRAFPSKTQKIIIGASVFTGIGSTGYYIIKKDLKEMEILERCILILLFEYDFKGLEQLKFGSCSILKNGNQLFQLSEAAGFEIKKHFGLTGEESGFILLAREIKKAKNRININKNVESLINRMNENEKKILYETVEKYLELRGVK